MNTTAETRWLFLGQDEQFGDEYFAINAVLRFRNQTNLLTHALKEAAVNLDQLEDKFRRRFGDHGCTYLTATQMEVAVRREAEYLGSETVDMGHVGLVLLRNGSILCACLQECGADVSHVRKALASRERFFVSA